MGNLRNEFNSKIRKSYITDNKITSCEKCEVSKDKASLHVHHINALADGGNNNCNNLIALCTRCHDEWHSIESYKFISFESWLDIPPYYVLVSLFHDISQLPGNLSPGRIKRIANVKFNLYKRFYSDSESSIKEKRQREGIEAKKSRGEWDDYGRPRAIDFDKFSKEYKRVLAGDIKPTECMKLLEITKPTYYRYRKEYDEVNVNK